MLSWLKINKSAIEHNLKQFRRLVGSDVLLMPVIKSNAYGHGFLEVAKILNQSGGVDRICVVNLDEAINLIDNKLTKKPILILSFFDWDEQKIIKAIKHGVIFPIYSLDYAKKLNKVGERIKTKIKIEIKVDTGASRIGILPKDALSFIKTLKQYNNITIAGIFSHFASSEEDIKQTREQYQIFNKTIKELEKNSIKIPVKHMACSAVPVLHKYANFNAVRLGISLYGLHPGNGTKNKIKLLPALSWKTKIIQIKYIPAKSKVSYGGTFVTKKPTKIAVLPIGYFDGYDRGLGNKAQVLIKGQKCPVLGRICMNLAIIDVSKIKDLKTGETAILIGKQGKNEITADDLARWAGTINYEIVSRINPLLPRMIK